MIVLIMPPALTIYQGRREFLPGAQVAEADIPPANLKAVKDWNTLLDAAVKTETIKLESAVKLPAAELQAIIDKAKAGKKPDGKD